jgi:hypothetical protein
MGCFYPLTAYKKPNGQIQFTDKNGGDYLTLPCGQCIGCKLERSRQWAMRCTHEASMHQDNCFITLTYDAKHLPPDCGLIKKDFQDFMKRLRKNTKKKFDTIIAENMEKKTTGPTITQYYSGTTLKIGSIYSTLQAVNLYSLARLSKKYGKTVS